MGTSIHHPNSVTCNIFSLRKIRDSGQMRHFSQLRATATCHDFFFFSGSKTSVLAQCAGRSLPGMNPGLQCGGATRVLRRGKMVELCKSAIA
jgi:hypothetical protein